MSLNKKRISLTINPAINNLLDDLSVSTNLSKSNLIEIAVSNFLDKKMETDAEFISTVEIEDVPSENEWLRIQSIIS
jgi:hypothetical protein